MGKYFWANRLQDWEVKDGRLQISGYPRFVPHRTVHVVTTRVKKPVKFRLTVKVGKQGSRDMADDLLSGAGKTLDTLGGFTDSMGTF